MTVEHQLQFALVGILSSVIALLSIVIRSYLKRIERHVNHVEDNIHEGDGMTLGQRVKSIADGQEEVKAELRVFARENDKSHARLWHEIEECHKMLVQEVKKAVGKR